MSYKIKYDTEQIRKYPMQKDGKHDRKWVVIIITMIVLIGLSAVRSDSMRRENVEIANVAFSEMLEDLTAGQTVVEAVSDFCVKVMQSESDR